MDLFSVLILQFVFFYLFGIYSFIKGFSKNSKLQGAPELVEEAEKEIITRPA